MLLINHDLIPITKLIVSNDLYLRILFMLTKMSHSYTVEQLETKNKCQNFLLTFLLSYLLDIIKWLA